MLLDWDQVHLRMLDAASISAAKLHPAAGALVPRDPLVQVMLQEDVGDVMRGSIRSQLSSKAEGLGQHSPRRRPGL